MNYKKKLISNFLSLSSVQVVNYILPLVTVPYIVRVIGPDKFGLIAFAQALIQYFIIVTDYGFNLSATREISICRDNKEKVSDIFSSIMIIKIVLMAVSFIIMCLLVFSIDKFREARVVYLLTFGIVVGNVLFPVWLFQGMEKMKQVALLNIFLKSAFTISIFFFITSQDDFIYIPLIYSLGYVVTGILSLWIIVNKIGIKFKFPAYYEITRELREGWYVFISTIAISLYTISNTFILGLLTNNTIVGYYSAGEKIIKAVQGLTSPISQTVYPHISKLASESKEASLIFIRKIVQLVGIPIFLVSMFLFILAPQISDIVLGAQFKASIPVIRILSFVPFVVTLSNIFAVQGLYAFGFYSMVAKFVSTIAVAHFLLVLVFTSLYSYFGTATSMLITEIIITCFSIYFFSKRILVKESMKRWVLGNTQ